MVVSNHQNNANDAIGLILAFKNKQFPTTFTSGVFLSKVSFLGNFFYSLGMLPAYRADYEGLENVEKNEASMEEMKRRLREGHPVIIYPEGTGQFGHYIGRFIPNYLHLAFQAAEADGWKFDVKVLPAANHYSDYFDVQTEFMIRMAPPFSLRPYYKRYQERPRTTVREINEILFRRVREMMLKGTGAIEIKSGYGLNTADEIKMLRVIRRIKESVPAEVRATFLGAHAVARGMAREDYVRLVCREMIPAVAAEGLADFIDVFCEEGFFGVEDTDRILDAGAKYGLVPKLHANQLHVSGGVQAGVRHGALSVDHLERTTEAEMKCLGGSSTMPTMLPGSSFFLREPYGNAKAFMDAGLGVALASDYNPGSSPSGDMRFVMALGCICMRMLPAQAFNAVTLNGAYAMGVNDIAGSIAKGKQANFILTKPGFDTPASLAYLHQTPFVEKVFLKGKEYR